MSVSTSGPSNRRECQRLKLPAMYTSVLVEPKPDMDGATLSGHAYDISESGVRIELDEPLNVGQPVKLHLGLPGNDQQISAAANVVWVNEIEDDPGPRRMALRFTEFASPADYARLADYLDSGAARLAA